ncbi:MAG: HAMP domain-containing histidine kinase, partial [Promethearchaeota archaeon]
EMVDIIESQVLRGANLISNVRKLSLLDSDSIDLKEISIKEILQRLITEITQDNSNEKIQIKVIEPEGELLINANELLYDVFKNLLLNAIKYNNNQIKKIEVLISNIERLGKKYYQLEFKDNGRGIRDERKENIFQRDYFDEEKGKGIGLGLSLVKRILDTYNATIEVENRIREDYHRGSNFILKIPRL